MGLDDENKCYRLGKDVRSLVNVENEVVLLSKSFSLFDFNNLFTFINFRMISIYLDRSFTKNYARS